MRTIWEWMLNNPWFTLFAGVTLIQVTPIKINPWTALFKMIKKWLGITELANKVDAIDQRFTKKIAEDARWDILDFSNSCQLGRKHTKEEWIHCLKAIDDYEVYCLKYGIKNGEIKEAAAYLRDLYHKLFLENNFL